MKKSDIERHGDRQRNGEYPPALNVKVYGFRLRPEHVIERFGCCERIATRACEYAEEQLREMFWEDKESDAREIFGSGVKVYSAGRSGGWLTVHGLPPIESWDAVALARWSKFAKWCDVGYYFTQGCVDDCLDAIEANGWADDQRGTHRERRK